jgi:hypothetical protein
MTPFDDARRPQAGLVVIVVAGATMEHVMDAVTDVAARGGDGVTAFAAEVGGFMAGGATGLGDSVANAPSGVLSGLDRAGQRRAGDGEGESEGGDKNFHSGSFGGDRSIG